MQTLRDFKRRHRQRQMLRRLAYSALLLIVIACVLLLTGCATNSVPPPVVCPVLPTMPSLSTPLPSTRYTDSVQSSLSAWESLRKATQMMSKP